MTADLQKFDPYHKWLGIPPHEQPPNHYRLLRIAPFESDAEVLENAYYREMADLKAEEHGQHGDLVESVSRELIAAYNCLHDAENKEAYDAELREELKAEAECKVLTDERAQQTAIDEAVRTATSRLTDERNRLRTLADQASAGQRRALLEVQRLRDKLEQLDDRESHATERLNILSLLHAVDQLLANLAGDGNTLLHGFLRVVAISLPIVVLVVVTLLVMSSSGDQTASGRSKSDSVRDTDIPPGLSSLTDRTVVVGNEVAFIAQANDRDDVAGALRFSLVDPPAGATIDAITGQFHWRPTEAQAGRDYRITVRVEDDGTPARANQESFLVTVVRPNRTPTLEALGNASIVAGEELRITARANDPDTPSNRLRFSLVNAPPDANIDADTGQFQWKTTMQDAGSSYEIILRVEDDGTPMGSDEKSLIVTVADPNNGILAGQARENNSLKMKLCWCPPGKFTMGSPKDEPGRRDNEDQVAATLTHGFWLGKYEVTQDQWVQVMGTKPWSGKDYVKEGLDYPATYVSWDDVMEFCSKLTVEERSGGRLPVDWQYTLPTEAQWEYACRAGSTTAFSFGNDESELGEFAWFDKNADDVRLRYAQLVDLKKPNSWGLHDMHGNVWEWCHDSYTDKLPGGTDPKVTSDRSLRVFRGGSWWYSAKFCRSAYRNWLTPSRRFSYLGFRVALVPSSK